MLKAQDALSPRLGGSIPQMVAVQSLAPGELADPQAALKGRGTKGQNLAAILSGTPAAPVLTGTPDTISQWQGPISLIAERAMGQGPSHYPEIRLAGTATSTADTNHGRIMTAQAGQTLLFLLTMLLAGMVLSNLVEEKGNKIIEILAAAIPMDAVFLGKLFAMLAVSFVGIAVWGATGGTIAILGGRSLQELTAPAVGWPLFFALGIAYFAMAYLLLGSLFLAIGSMASTVREVQTLSMPVTMLQLLVFFFASFAMSQQGTAIELAAVIIRGQAQKAQPAGAVPPRCDQLAVTKTSVPPYKARRRFSCTTPPQPAASFWASWALRSPCRCWPPPARPPRPFRSPIPRANGANA